MFHKITLLFQSAGQNDMSVTRKLSEFIADLKLDHFPDEAVQRASEAILDCTGVALAGTREPCSVKVADWVRETGGNSDSGVPAFGFRTAPPGSALIWGTAAHALDYDDVMNSLTGHPSVTLVPVIYCLGRKYGASGRQALEAFLTGLEVEGKLGRAVSLPQYAAGWHATATVGSLGAAAAASKLMGLDAGQIQMALGIAASMAGGLRQNFGTMTKPLHAGMAARNGVSAAMLAARGFTADEDILEARFGFANVFCGPGKFDLNPVAEGLGKSWEALTPGITIKKYPCCALTHRAVDAILKIREENGLPAEQVDSIVCRIDKQGVEVLIHSRPRTGLEGKFSMQYCAAAALIEGNLGMDQFYDAAVTNPKAQDLLKRVAVEVLAESNMRAQSAVVEIKDRNGRLYSCRIEKPKGHPENPLAWQELVHKYRGCAGIILPPAVVNKTEEYLGDIKNLKSLDPLLDLIEMPDVRSKG